MLTSSIFRTAEDKSPNKGPSQSSIPLTKTKENKKSEVEMIREFKARMAEMSSLKPRLTPFLAFSSVRWAQFRAEIPDDITRESQNKLLNNKVKSEWEQMTEEEKAVYVKKVRALQ